MTLLPHHLASKPLFSLSTSMYAPSHSTVNGALRLWKVTRRYKPGSVCRTKGHEVLSLQYSSGQGAAHHFCSYPNVPIAVDAIGSGVQHTHSARRGGGGRCAFLDGVLVVDSSNVLISLLPFVTFLQNAQLDWKWLCV